MKSIGINHPSFNEFSDREVVDAVLAGNKQLFELLMRRYNQHFYRLARGIVNNGAEAEDVLQEAYIKAYANLRQCKTAKVKSWLGKIVINEALMRLRQEKRFRSLDEVADIEPLLMALNENNNHKSLQADPEYIAVSHELLWLIEAAVARLPVEYRIVYVLRALEQFSTDETAEYLGIKSATVKTRYHRAKALLQDKFNRYTEEAIADIFQFGGEHCDRIVSSVLERI